MKKADVKASEAAALLDWNTGSRSYPIRNVGRSYHWITSQTGAQPKVWRCSGALPWGDNAGSLLPTREAAASLRSGDTR